MTDRTTPEGIEAWLTQASTNPWTLPAVVGPELSKEILQHIYGHWGTYSNNIKLGVLFAILCIRRLLVGGLKAEIAAIVTSGTHDKDEWVRLISRMLQEYPNSLIIDLNIEQYIPEKAKIGLQDLAFRIRKNGIKFYPVEYAFTDREICESFSTVASSINAPTLHFNLRSENSSNHDRQLKLNNLQLLPSPSLTSPTNSNGFNLDSQLNRGQSQGPSRSNTAPSLFIPKRRPSQLSLPIPRSSIPPLQRPGSINIGSSNTSPVLKSPEIKISQRKKYQKPTRIQMIDISTGTSIIKNQEESRRQTQLEEQHQKELKRQERARKAEERRREEDERKQQREREKAEKARQREEAKQAKEREKKERASRSNSISEPQSGGRKKKKLNEEETIEEETIVISDGELPHKPNQVTLASPSSPTSTTKLSTNVEQNREEQRSQENLLPTNGPNPEVTSETTIHTPASIPSEQPSNYNENYEEIPAREMSQKDRRLFYCNCNAVLSQANQVEKNPELRQIIINFLGGVHELKELMDVSSGVSSPDDALRHIVLHEQTVRSPEGKAIKETFLFEMNINDGKWRKLKRRKTRGFKEKKNQETEEGENPEDFVGENNENGEENNRELEE